MSGFLELQGNKWTAKCFKGEPEIKINPTSIHQSVSLLDSQKSIFLVEAEKVTAINLDKCLDCGLVVKANAVLSSIDLINCKKIKVEVDAAVPTICIDGCEAVTFYLSPEHPSPEFITSKCCEIVIVRGEQEFLIPEQFKSRLEGDGLMTAPVEHVGV